MAANIIFISLVDCFMSQQHILQVSELTSKVRFMLESELNRVWLCGEISNFVAASSGHWYLSLKDKKSQVRCAMFKGNNQRTFIKPKNGQQVLVRAKVSLYEPRGDFQLIIEQMDDAGDGLLKQQYEQLKQKLNDQGLFDQRHKVTIPPSVNTIGIITSPTGAAVKDILTVLKRRSPNINTIIYPALVQGNQASMDIVSAINTANLRNECQLLIVGRGGGSLEDLWCFNEEAVVRAIFASSLPIISAVGHEVDTTLADYAADLRAATPSAAAELASQDNGVLKDKNELLSKQLRNNLKRNITDIKQRLSVLNHRLNQVHPSQKLALQQQKVDELESRLLKYLPQKLSLLSNAQSNVNNRLIKTSPSHQINLYQQQLSQLTQRLLLVSKLHLQAKKSRFGHILEQLHIVSPLATIARGYNVARNENKDIIRSVEQVTPGEKITLQMADGDITAEVVKP